MAFDPISAGISVIGFGLNLFGKSQADRQAQRAEEKRVADERARSVRAHRNAVFERTQQNLLIDHRNTLVEKNFSTKVGLAKQQMDFNRSAAGRAFVQEDMRLNEVFAQAAFQRAGMQKQLLQAQGAAAAMGGNRGRSFKLAADKQNLGTFGEDQAKLVQMLGGERVASQFNRQSISNRLQSDQFAAFSQIAIPDHLQMNLPGVQAAAMPTSNYVPRQMNALGIATAGFGMINSYNSMAPEEMRLNANNPSFK